MCGASSKKRVTWSGDNFDKGNLICRDYAVPLPFHPYRTAWPRSRDPLGCLHSTVEMADTETRILRAASANFAFQATRYASVCLDIGYCHVFDVSAIVCPLSPYTTTNVQRQCHHGFPSRPATCVCNNRSFVMPR